MLHSLSREFLSLSGTMALVLVIMVALVVGRRLRDVRDAGRSVPNHLAAMRPAARFTARYPRASAWLARRVDTRSPTGFRLTFVAVLGATCWWIFGALTEDVVAHNDAVLTDPDVARFVADHRVSWLTSAMTNITWLGASAVLVPLVVVAALFLVSRSRRGDAAVLAVALAGSKVLYVVVKVLVHRPRPPEAYRLVAVGPYSFPSGHAVAAAAVWFALALIYSRGRSKRVRIGMWLGAAVIIAVVCLSRVYLGVHWWTDVAAGAALGGGWLCVALAARTSIDAHAATSRSGDGPRSSRPLSQPVREPSV